jgi:hypothetical protein
MLIALRASAGIATLSLLACTRLNPAFGGETETSSDSVDTKADASSSAADEAGATSDSMTSEADATSAAESQSDTEATDTQADATQGSESTETGGLECALDPSEPLRFKLYSETALEPCGEILDAYFAVNGPSPNQHLSVQPCTAGCETCEDSLPLEIEAYPADLTDLANMLQGQCIHVEYGDLVADSTNYCQYSKGFISEVVDFQEELPVLVGSSHDGAKPPGSEGFFESVGAQWEIVPDEVCECPDDDPCCLPGDPPTLYAFDLGLESPLAPGEFHEFQDSVSGWWEFQAWQADYLMSCGGALEVSWLVLATE